MKNTWLIILNIFMLKNIYGQNLWKQKNDFAGGKRNLSVSFSIGSKGYMGTGIIGIGSNGLDIYQKDFWEWDQSMDTWTQKADFGGNARCVATGFSIRTKGYIGTGWNENLGIFFKDFWEWDQITNIWTQKADYGGGERFYPVGFSIGMKGYIGTGKDSNNILQNDFWEYNPLTNIWIRKADVSGEFRTDAVGFSIGIKGYIGLGSTFSSHSNDDFWEYDPSTDKWTKKADFSGGRRQDAVAFSIGCKGYVGLGEDGDMYKDFWEYDPNTNIWTKKVDFGGDPRDEAIGFSIGNKGYIGFGGEDDKFQDFWEYTPDSLNVFACGNITINSGTSATLTAAGGVLYLWSPATGLDCISCALVNTNTSITTNYTLTVTDANGCPALDTVRVTVLPYVSCEEPFVPDAFSPNGDKDNDIFYVRINPACLKDFDLIIFNRWGQKVFETENITQGWDGTFSPLRQAQGGLSGGGKGEELNPGIFAYTLKGEQNGKPLKMQGLISLIK